MTTKTLSDKIEMIGDKHLPHGWSDKTAREIVEEWNWNSNIFEIYDQVKEWHREDQEIVLEFGYHYFNKDHMINELASFLLGQGFDD